MIKIILSNGLVKEFSSPLTIKDVVLSISIILEKITLAGIIDNKIYFTDYLIKNNCWLELITTKSKQAFDIINYTASLITIKILIRLYPDIQLIKLFFNKEGFFIDFKNNFNITKIDLNNIEKYVWKSIKKNINIINIFNIIKNICNLKNFIILDEIEKNKQSKIYKNFYLFDKDCLNNNIYIPTYLKYIKSYKILKSTKIYFQNIKNNSLLQRIYGIAHISKKLFNQLIIMLYERKHFNHRKLGKNLEIFYFNKLIGSGLPIWLPNGMNLKKEIQNYIREKEWEYDFIEVSTPIIGSHQMYKISGHWQHYKNNMFPPMVIDNEVNVLRPMSCPHHIMVYNFKKRSYRDLPLRISEHAILHRYELSGSLSGLERVKMMQLTDAHIFVRSDQIKKEFKRCFWLIHEVLTNFNIKIDYYLLSLHDPNNKQKYYNDNYMWNISEKILKELLDELKIKYIISNQDAAFYGPKLDFQIKTLFNHDITISTLQFDFVLSKKFNIWYINEKGEKQHPIIIHRGLIGTYERFISILLEQTKGILPLWLSPYQIVIIPIIIEQHLVFCEKICNLFKKVKIRSYIDKRDERLNYKIRCAQISKIPYQLVIGDKEIKNNIVTYRKYNSTQLIEISLDNFINLINKRIINKI